MLENVKSTVDDVAIVSARRADVRCVVSQLHEEGFVDALLMRPTAAVTGSCDSDRTSRSLQLLA